VQSITIGERHFPRYRSSTDFIQQYIFPGGMLPSVERFERSAARAGLHSEGHYAFGRDYAETLRRWRSAYHAARAQVVAQGFDAHFMRIWDLYFAYCEAAFDEEGRTDVVQFLLHKRRAAAAGRAARCRLGGQRTQRGRADWRTQLPQAQALAVAT
jgi:cyclopropane-fatty-acyl-phospholipid synthase